MIDKEKVKQQAKQIMDEFMLALDKIQDQDESFGIERKHETRQPDKNRLDNIEFRERMLKNAPRVENNCIAAEKKKW